MELQSSIKKTAVIATAFITMLAPGPLLHAQDAVVIKKCS